MGTEPGGEEVELEDFVADLEFSVFLDIAEIRREPEAARGDAGAREGGFGGDGVSDFGRVGRDVLLDDGLPFAVEFGGFFLNLLCGRFNAGGFLLDDGLARCQGFLAEFLGLVDGFAAEFLALGDGFGTERFGLGSDSGGGRFGLLFRGLFEFAGFGLDFIDQAGGLRFIGRLDGGKEKSGDEDAVTEERSCRRCTTCEGRASPQWANQSLVICQFDAVFLVEKYC